MKVSAARRIAFEVLRRVEKDRAYAGDALHAKLGAGVKRADAALGTELTFGVLRWQGLLDFLIERQTSKRVAALDLEVVLALRLGLYQLRFLTRVPARAAVNESVELVRAAGKRSAAGLVNAVLRRAPREPVEALLPDNLTAAQRLAICGSHPGWMVERWLERFGETRTRDLLEANNRAPRVTCVLHGGQPGKPVLPKPAAAGIAALQKAGLVVEPGQWLRDAVAVRGGELTRTEAYRQGWVSIQDEASQMVPLLLEVRPGQTVLDLCAAPGGKTMALARAAGNKGQVIAGDRHVHRLRAMRMQLQRVGAAGVRLVALDSTAPLPLRGPFDRILVDAPCSGTGTLARNPEIRWRLAPTDLQDFHKRQTAMLANALEQLAHGGRLVYSTCSLEREENEDVVQEALRGREDLRSVHFGAALEAHLVKGARVEELAGEDGFFRTFPPQHHTEGFFAAVVERRA